MDQPEKGHYDSTISESKDASLAKAMEIMMQDLKNRQIQQVIVRPKVSLLKGLIPILIFLGSLVFLLINSKNISGYISLSPVLTCSIISALYLVVAIIFMKSLLIWLILIYQKYAPEKIRKQCCFEPSCSEYMKLSIQKYGVIRGIYKGGNRLLRCHWPNGGVDYP